MTTKKEEKAVAVATPIKRELVLEGDPQAQLEFAMKAANALMTAVGQKKSKVMIRGEQYLEYGDWQTLARFFGATAGVAWSKKLVDEKGAFIGYEARAEVLHNGVVISSAEAMCMKAEKNWAQRDEFMLRSMAQTRASAKALRNAYGWVAELAGMKSTPAEEMDGVAGYDASPIHAKAVPVVHVEDHEAKPQTVDEKKLVIKRLVDGTVLHPLDQTAAAYKDYVWEQTGYQLVESSYDEIIEVLTAIQHGEKN